MSTRGSRGDGDGHDGGSGDGGSRRGDGGHVGGRGGSVGGGLVAPPVRGVAELAAIGVRAGHRRRGIARALTALLTRACAGTGITTPFLTPAGPAEERIYRSVGYRPATEMLHISRPEPAPDGSA